MPILSCSRLLVSLKLKGCSRLRQEQLAHLNSTSLTQLDVSGCTQISSLLAISQLASLRELDISGKHTTNQAWMTRMFPNFSSSCTYTVLFSNDQSIIHSTGHPVLKELGRSVCLLVFYKYWLSRTQVGDQHITSA